ncbi:hypothetical protein V5N11_017083 [Cardamine amara subsp. amara]|uniref:RNase H type-1 domain-containing protein n=1 Tax=Cardamine amara subsp. amara TaxID=228776 RepID=A0ABD0ZF00_CARAN
MEPFIIHVFSGFDTGSIVMKMALFEAAWKAFMGWFLQSSDLKFHPQDSTHRHSPPAFVAEALAIIPSMFATQAVGTTSLACFLDCQDLIRLLNAGGPANELQRVMFKFQAFCHMFSSISFRFVALSAFAADTLAKATLVACTTSSFIGV